MAKVRRIRIPYDSHPLYSLRRSILIAGTVGVLLNTAILLALSSSYGGMYRLPNFVLSTALLCGSIAFVSYDLVTYGTRTAVILASQAKDDDTLLPQVAHAQPTWPSKVLLVGDFIFAVALQWLFWGLFFVVASSGYYDRYGGSETLEAYANLTNFAASVLHGVAFWKELLARKKSQWQRDLDTRPCGHCGHVTSIQDEASHSEAVITALNEQAGPSSEPGPSTHPTHTNFGRIRKLVLPKWARPASVRRHDSTDDRDVEKEAAGDGAGEPLLVTPDESTEFAGQPSGTYGSMSQSVESLSSVPETIVKKKDKGKKRMVDVDEC
ncbi:hypothetical protein DPSP01_009018 [Paraphaeosphaeria sporulosa]|uniref:Uncharacterized protein n=1 Tax=Paraphaeosphaeria sporulosa TaxID=1460663 RepID=A0A177C994_9PLEO|nr:uncharacterized protein CC84DRAFT_1260572 [Paraphaeosphaeria sporulosa]OAG03409.1 hypothetical protein CC84DRAFT_1260572 [Paraphaeosphaeria sporulosa]